MNGVPWYILVPVALVALVVMFVMFAWGWLRFWRARLRLPDGFDEVVELRTRDGAVMVLGRIRPRGVVSPRPPVLLCHGLAMNRNAMALDPQRSLARMLAERGRDCWLVELRGASLGSHGREVLGASFDTYLAYDIPMAIEHVRAATDAPSVDWVGFSMGGMLIYAYLGAMQGEGVRRLVTVGSPVRFAGRVAQSVGRMAPYLLKPLGARASVPLGVLATGAAPLLGWNLPLALTHGFRGAHYDAAGRRRIFASSFSDVPTGVIGTFARWMRDDSFTSDDGEYDYRASLAAVRVPTLVIAGDRDRLARPECVREGYELLGSEEKRFVEVGPDSGAHEHYDHLDLILGGRAHEEVSVQVIEWVERD